MGSENHAYKMQLFTSQDIDDQWWLCEATDPMILPDLCYSGKPRMYLCKNLVVYLIIGTCWKKFAILIARDIRTCLT